MNTALASTIKTLKNIFTKRNIHKDHTKDIVGIREEIITMKEVLRSEQQQIAENAVENPTSTLYI